MTREEAIATLKEIRNTFDEIHENTNWDIGYEQMTAIDMAIEALSADAVSREEYEEVKAYMDTLVDAFIEDGEELAESVKVVRCKDCRHYIVEGITTQYGWCHEYKHSVDEDDYCSYGERKK